MKKIHIFSLVGLISTSLHAGIVELVEGAGETATAPLVGISPEHSTRYHLSQGTEKMAHGTGDIVRSPLTLGIGVDDEYYNEYYGEGY